MGRIKKATKKTAKARAAFFGPSGAGKTYTAMRVARGLAGAAGRVGVIDTERGSASKYSDRFAFDVLELPAEEHSIEDYVAAIAEFAAAGHEVLIIDSLSHGWQQLVEEVDKLANAKYRGNGWSAWSEGTPRQRKLVDAILGYPGHVIATMRSRTAWEATQGKGGKTQPVRIGLAPEQGKGIEYEFDILLEISTDHIGNVIKDRTGKFQDEIIKEPGEKLGQQIAAWLEQGEGPAGATPQALPQPAPQAGPDLAAEPGAPPAGYDPFPKVVEDALAYHEEQCQDLETEGFIVAEAMKVGAFHVHGNIARKALEKYGQEAPEKRDAKWAYNVAANFYNAYPKGVKATVAAYLKEKRDTLIPDPAQAEARAHEAREAALTN